MLKTRQSTNKRATLKKRQINGLFMNLSFFSKFFSFQLCELLTAFFLYQTCKPYIKTFTVYDIGFNGLVLFKQQGWCMVISVWNLQLPCVTMEQFSPDCRQTA
jgi:hypothetical protein